MRDLVHFKSSKLANTVVRGPTGRYAVYTNPDDSTGAGKELVLDRDIAEQLQTKGVGKIGKDASPEEAAGFETVSQTAAERREEFAEDDDADDSNSGADSRDTTAFQTPPLESAGTAEQGDGTAAADDADAAPASDDADAADAGTTTTRTASTGRRRGAAATS